MTRKPVAKPPYHHGNLRAEIITAALDQITEHGAAALSLRDLARRAGVSHAAPAHHFGDKAGLITAIATEGFELLAGVLRDAHERGTFLDVGLAYVAFATEHPAHFDVMFRLDLYRADDPALVAARTVTNQLLYGPASEVGSGDETMLVGIAGWAFVHGFATLWNSGNLQHRLGDDPLTAARAVGRLLFTRDQG
jgi:AcrR family transcriptional regulator